METKKNEKNRAINLRKQGLSYSEILKEVLVAKSTLSLWLRDVGLSKIQKHTLTQKKLEASIKGGQKKRNQRLERTLQIKKQANNEIGEIDKNVIKLLGAFLYWAEGSKQKSHSVSTGVKFSNSDPLMINFFYKWLLEVCEVDSKSIYFELYIHENSDIEVARKYWSKFIPITESDWFPVRWKKNKVSSKRKNNGKDYFGLIRINVRRSTDLNRKIMAWVEETYKRSLNINYSGVG